MSYESKMHVICEKELAKKIKEEIKKLPEWVGGHPLSHYDEMEFSYIWDDTIAYVYFKFDWCNNLETTDLYKYIKDIASDLESEYNCKMAVIGEDNSCEVIDNSDGAIEGLDITVSEPKSITIMF